jgi:hypothetical protein
MIETIDGVVRLTCDNPANHLRGWAYRRGVTEKEARELAHAGGWFTDKHGRDLCPTCAGNVYA